MARAFAKIAFTPNVQAVQTRMGSRDARDEPRNWRFALRKTANDEWQIESALVVR